MELNLDTFYSNVRQLQLPDEFKAYTVETAIEQIRKLGLDKDLLEIYPQNLFTNKMIVFYLFHANSLSRVHFEIVEEAENLIHIETIDYSNIELLKFSVSSELVPFNQLTIKLKSGEKILLNNIQDTNTHWAHRFKEKVVNIYKLLK
jgi:hypothetical protein